MKLPTPREESQQPPINYFNLRGKTMFGKVTSTGLLKAAAKSEASATKALAVAQAAQADAAKKRELARTVEVKERVAELSKAETAAKLFHSQASNAYMAAVAERNTAEAALAATQKKVAAASEALQAAASDFNRAKAAADVERARIEPQE
jgi:phage I-like protein